MKIAIDIDADGEYCGDCRLLKCDWNLEEEYQTKCTWYDIYLSRNTEDDPKRCPQCLDAKIMAAEKERVKVLEDALNLAKIKMTAARSILTDGNPRPSCNWGMLDSYFIDEILEATSVNIFLLENSAEIKEKE